MTIEHNNGEIKGFFKALLAAKEAGRITYSWAGKERFIIDHTEVNPDFKGKDVGLTLVLSAVSYARENGLKIIPLCPFAKSVFDKNGEIRDVL
jgi:predicted GNAT family acetyltransferase